MDATLFPHPTPFMMMASSDYSPYPLHTAQASSPHRRRNAPAYLGTSPPRRKELYVRNHYTSTSPRPVLRTGNNGPPTSRRHHAAKQAPAPRPVRVDSGFNDTASTASSITYTEEVERRFELRQYLLQIRRDGYGEGQDEGRDETGEDEGELGGQLGRMARDSIDMNISRAGTWDSKESRSKRNRRSKAKVFKVWVVRLFEIGR